MADIDVDVCDCGELIVGPMSVHKYKCHEPKYCTYDCPQCRCEFVTQRELESHMQIVECMPGVDGLLYRRPLLSAFHRLQQCKECSFKCVHTRKMGEHVMAKHPKTTTAVRTIGRGRGLLAPPDPRISLGAYNVSSASVIAP